MSQARLPAPAAATAGALLLGAVSTFGDWLWANFIPDGAMVPGIVHGIVIFAVLAAILAWASGRRTAFKLLLVRLPIAGALIAAAFYPLYAVLGYGPSLLVTWVAMWWVTAWLQQKARGDLEGFGRTAARALLAAVFSGLAFWSISGIWTSPAADGPDYLWNFACWSFAFLPGFLALLVAQPAVGRPNHHG